MDLLCVPTLLVPFSCTRIASMMGAIMAVVAAFEIHIDRNHVADIMPSISLHETRSRL